MNTETQAFFAVANPRGQEMDAHYDLWAEVLRFGVSEAMAEMQARAAGMPANRYANAMDWLNESRDLGPGSFIWLCSLWGFDPERLRNCARRNALALAEVGRAFAEIAHSEQPNAAEVAPLRSPPPAPAKETRICIQCGKPFLAFVSRPDRYCSHACRDALKRERARAARSAALKTLCSLQTHAHLY